MEDSSTRFVILGLATVIQAVTLECPTALVWNYFGENKTPSALLASPLDYLPNCAPSGLPMPPRACNQPLRHRIKVAETLVKERSTAAESKWSGESALPTKGVQSTRNVNLVLSILEELDSYVFERMDSSSNCLDSLFNRLFNSSSDSGNDDILIHTLCDWAVTFKRSGEHRAFVVSKLLEMRQAQLTKDCGVPEESEAGDLYAPATPLYFQSQLFHYLNNDAPTLPDQSQEFSNLILLYYELICHDVFSHDSYMCQLISRGDLFAGSSGDDDKPKKAQDEHDGSFEDSKNLDSDLSQLVTQIKDTNQLHDSFSPGPPSGPSEGGKDAKGDKAVYDVSKFPRHKQYCYHLPLPPPEGEDDSSAFHDSNQRQVLLFGAGCGVGKGEGKGSKDEASFKVVKNLRKDIMKLFSKKFSIDVSEGGKIKKHSPKDFSFDDVLKTFQGLSYHDQHAITHHCGVAVLEMLAAFNNSNANYLPVAESVSFLMDLTGLALNLQEILEWSMQILKELPGVENQLIERGSCLTRNYTTMIALYVVGVFRRYHSILILNPADVAFVFDQLTKIAYKPKLPGDAKDGDGGKRGGMLDCNSGEWCILAYQYDLSCSCSLLKTKDKFPELKRLFSHQVEPSLSSVETLTDRKFGIDYIVNPKKPIDPLTIKLLIESPQNQYNLVCNILMEVCECNDTDKLNDIAILCCEFTSQCNNLSSEWLGALAALCYAGSSRDYPDLLAQVSVGDASIYNRLGIFASILIARHCFQLQAFVISVAIPSLLKAWEEVKERQVTKETENGARLSCHLLLKLFKSVDSIHSSSQLYYSLGSPKPMPGPSSHTSGIKSSCDRHLLSSAHKNITVGAIIAVLKAILVLGDAENKSSIHSLLGDGGGSKSGGKGGNFDEDDDFGLGLSLNSGRGGIENSSLSEFAKHTLRQICCQEWVHDRCLQVPDDLLKNGTLLDPMLTPKQAQKLLRLICYPSNVPQPDFSTEPENQKKIITKILSRLDHWNLRLSAVDVRLMYHQLSTNNPNVHESGTWLENAAHAVVDMFELTEESGGREDEKKKKQKESDSIWMIPYLVKHLKFLQSRVLKVSGQVLEASNWSRANKSRVQEASSGHIPFLQVVLTCIRELDADCKDKKDKADREEQKECLLQSLHTQLSTYLCFTKDEKIYNYEDPMARKLMQDSLQLRFSLVGGMFDSIWRSQNSTIEKWSILFAQLISRGVVDLTNNSDLFTTVLDMLATLIHSTLVNDRTETDRNEESRKHTAYHTLVKKLKKEVGENNSVSIRYLRQLLPFPKITLEAIVAEPFGTVSDGKGNKVKGFNVDKKQGLQVSDKQKINPWDILEGHRNPAPLSWSWFRALKHERKPMKYEESFVELKYASTSFINPSSYYLEAPPLPTEDLEPPNKENKDGGKDGAAAGNMAAGVGPINQGMGNMGGMPGGQMGMGNSNMGMMNNAMGGGQNAMGGHHMMGGGPMNRGQMNMDPNLGGMGGAGGGGMPWMQGGGMGGQGGGPVGGPIGGGMGGGMPMNQQGMMGMHHGGMGMANQFGAGQNFNPVMRGVRPQGTKY
jgi:mediator of RNA polymerase II transcription subunit 12